MSEEFEAPLRFPAQRVRPEWVDFNGHMNVAYYLVAFDRCLDVMYNRLGVGPDHIAETGCSVFTLEAHISYLREVLEGDTLHVTGWLLDCDDKRLHSYFEMSRTSRGPAVAALEQLGIHVDMAQRRSVPFADAGRQRVQGMTVAHAALPAARYAGRVVGIRRR